MTTSTFTDQTKFEPVVDADKGGTSLGNSYLSLWTKCPRSWYNNYYRKVETPTHVGQGIEELGTSLPLLSGTLFHEGLDAYYSSGWKNNADSGEYDLKAAEDAVKAQWLSQKNRYATEEIASQDFERVSHMIREYHTAYGLKGTARDWPDLRIMGSESGPLVEQDFRFELKKGYWYTGRLDAIAQNRGEIVVFEHKTTSAYGISKRLSSLSYDSQFTGEIWLAQQALPDVSIDRVLVNIVVKDRSPNSKYGVAVREYTRRTDRQIKDWVESSCSVIDAINDAVGMFEFDVNKNVRSIEEAENKYFPKHGERNGHCTAYGKPCEYSDLCQLPGMEHKVLKTFRWKNVTEKGT